MGYRVVSSGPACAAKMSGRKDVAKPLDYETRATGPPAWHGAVRLLVAAAFTAAFAACASLGLMAIGAFVQRIIDH